MTPGTTEATSVVSTNANRHETPTSRSVVDQVQRRTNDDALPATIGGRMGLDTLNAVGAAARAALVVVKGCGDDNDDVGVGVAAAGAASLSGGWD